MPSQENICVVENVNSCSYLFLLHQHTLNTGLAEARVAALKEVISDFEQETQRMQLSEVLEEDHR